jgi:hypothetical protein
MLVQVGFRTGRLSVVGETTRAPWGHRRFVCLCDCGRETVVTMPNLRGNKTRSCGCLLVERTIERNTTHGFAKVGRVDPVYSVWLGIKDRCINPRSRGFANYGGRGITVCPEWASSFETFLSDMGPRPSDGHSVDRIDNSKGYSPENCRWATRLEQGNNTRRNVIVTYERERMTFPEACRRTGVNYKTARNRMARGLPEAEWFKPAWTATGRRRW